MKKWTLAAAALSVGALTAVAHEHHDHGAPFDEAAWMERTTPGAHHEHLHRFVGDWDAEMTYRMLPGVPEEEGSFVSSWQMVMDGRFVEETVTSETPMGVFEGRGVYGYDNTKKRFVSMWYDNMNTSFFTSEGFWDESSSTFEFHGKGPDMNGDWKRVRLNIEFHNEDTFAVREWVYEDDGTRWQRFDATYTRQ